MKKNHLLWIMFVLYAGLVHGQSVQKQHLNTEYQRIQNKNVSEKRPMDKVEKAHLDVRTASLGALKDFKFTKKAYAPTAAIETEYRRPWGSMVRTSVFEEGGEAMQWSSPLLVVPARKTLPFLPWANDTEAVFTWSITTADAVIDLADEVDVDGTLNYYFDIVTPHGYQEYIPEIKATVGSNSGTYKYGQEIETGSSFTASQNNITNADPDYNYSLTDCDMHLGGGLYSGFETGESFGSNYNIDGISANAIMSAYEAPLGVLSFSSIDVLATTGSTMIPSGKSLILSIFYLTEAGTEEEPVATATATNADLRSAGDINFINFKFIDIDEDGFETDKIVHLKDRPYVVIVSGFDSTFDIDFMFSTAHGWTGSAYTINNGEIKTIGYSNDPSSPMCVYAISFNGVFNCFEVESETNYLTIPNGGGEAVDNNGQQGSIVYTTFGIEELESLEMSDWLTIGYDDSDFEAYNVVYFSVTGKVLPTGVTGRTGKIVLGSYGSTTTIHVKQGDAEWTGISSTKSIEQATAVRQDDSFLLTYPQGTLSVAAYSVTGQKIAELLLNTGGNSILPANKWANGVYILKFAGKTNETIKVIK